MGAESHDEVPRKRREEEPPAKTKTEAVPGLDSLIHIGTMADRAQACARGVHGRLLPSASSWLRWGGAPLRTHKGRGGISAAPGAGLAPDGFVPFTRSNLGPPMGCLSLRSAWERILAAQPGGRKP